MSVIASSQDEEAEHLHVLEEELVEVKKELEQDVEATTGERVEVELKEVLELEDDYKEVDFDMIAGKGVVGVSESCMNTIRRTSQGSEITVGPAPKKTLRHEWAHIIDGKINEKKYEEIEADSPTDIKQAPKEAYAIFEDLRASSQSDMDHSLPRGFSAVKDWDFLTDINVDGEIICNEKPSARTPHRLGYYAAKTLEEAANKKYEDRKKAENEVRKTLLETTTVDGLLSEISEAHQELGHPFYIDILEDVSGEVAEKDEYELTLEMAQRINKYDDNPLISLEEFYQDHALVQSCEDIYGEKDASTQLRQQLEEYRRNVDHDKYISDKIIIDGRLGTSDEYLEWLPG